jgi:NAD(P)-dependent dehydrogenase (short-subunit alcohol dehydrogenase family)
MTTSHNDEHSWIGPGRGRMDGKVAVVTAANSGIGRATARLFAREGAKVVCVDIAERGEPRVDQLIRDDGGEAVFLLGDVTTKETCQQMVATAIKEFGELHVLFLNAGTGTRAPLHETSEEQWHHVVETNLDSIYQGVNAVLPHFMEEGRGNIVATSSALGVLGSPNYPAYSATKAGIINLTRVLAVDYGPAIRVNCVCPGPIETNRVREFPPRPRPLTDTQIKEMGTLAKALHRMGKPEEVAYAVLFLASDESSYVTGHALVVDGGSTIAP